MKSVAAYLLIGLAVTSAAAPAVAQERKIILPADHDYARLKSGPGSDLAQTQCQLCHSTDYIVMQPGGDAKLWEGVVTKMIKVFGAPLSEADAKAITEYLTKSYPPAK
jgi:sulfite dehydrogenase (cytochrome) subunit B